MFDATEFNLAVRSLPTFLKVHKNVGLVVVDGLHYIENIEYYFHKDHHHHHKGEDTAKSDGSKQSGKKGHSNVQMLASKGNFSTDDFMGFGAAGVGADLDVANDDANEIRHNFTVKRGAKVGQKHDFQYYDGKLITRALELINDYKKVYKFVYVNCQAKPNLRKTADLLEQVMGNGLQINEPPKLVHKESKAADESGATTLELQVKGQINALELNDNVLRDNIKNMGATDVIILRGDRQNSLLPKSDPKKVHDSLLSQQLSCLLLPQPNFPGDHVVREQLPYVKRFMALYFLFKMEAHKYRISDGVIRAFYM